MAEATPNTAPIMAPTMAVQLYTLRNYGNIEAALKLAADAGYDAVETVGMHGVSVDTMQALLDNYGLQVCSSHVGLDELQHNLAAHIAFNRQLGNHHLVLPWLAADARPQSFEAWHALGQTLATLVERCRQEDITLHYHNHDFEMLLLGDHIALDALAEGARTLHLELDLAWIVRGQQDPATLLQRYAARVSHVHVKDLAQEEDAKNEGGWADVGYGRMAWPPLLRLAYANGVRYFIVEHDEPADPARTVKRSADYLRPLLDSFAASNVSRHVEQ